MYSSTVTEYEEKKTDSRNVEENPEVDVEPLPVSMGQTPVKRQIIWLNVFGLGIIHFLAIYSLARYYQDAKFWTWIWNLVYGHVTGLGVTAGAHRLWAHRSYSAKLPLQIFLGCLFCMAGQTRPYNWIRDHRTHHKFTETAADPHDANRGFFFSHMGWLMVKRHPAVKEYGSKVDMSDIATDPVMQFFNKYFEIVMFTLSFALPIMVPVFLWGESWHISTFAAMIRYVWSLHATFIVNSFAHMWGNRPYNRRVKPTENATVSFFTLGEGWHNYHHSFPWDYKAAELGGYGLNVTTGFIELMARLGLAYNLKTPSKELIERTSLKKGDGTDSVWGQRRH
ncbi:acyl-CoA Delta-9 desaturase [Ptiloglossa arizonensis]|uniref:acyl-CoA Delta-9 desaturase n=1 Tax=Ptiloglossa arizonensis TaxID=3350558 RepID=UPI003FA1704B